MVTSKIQFYPKVTQTILSLTEEFKQISVERKALLNELAHYIKGKVQQEKPIALTIICTHNSRRSHLGQVWLQIAAQFYGIPNVQTYSGGTEATACNPRIVACLERIGFYVIPQNTSINPVYRLYGSDHFSPQTLFSKVYDAAANPTSDFAAVMVCNSADEACPTVIGADYRIAMTYIDPKVSDNTPKERATYDERCRQIGRECLYVMSLV